MFFNFFSFLLLLFLNVLLFPLLTSVVPPADAHVRRDVSSTNLRMMPLFPSFTMKQEGKIQTRFCWCFSATFYGVAVVSVATAVVAASRWWQGLCRGLVTHCVVVLWLSVAHFKDFLRIKLNFCVRDQWWCHQPVPIKKQDLVSSLSPFWPLQTTVKCHQKTSYASGLAWSPKRGGAADSYSGVLIGLRFIAGC